MTSNTTGIVVWRWEQAVVKPWDGVLLEVKNRPKEFGALDLGKTLIHFSKKKKSNASSKAFAPTNTPRGNCKKKGGECLL